MTEKIFKKLGFERTDVLMEESGCSNDFYYYSLDIGDICIMSNANDEATEKGWKAFIFDSNTMLINNPNDLKQLVKIIKSNTKETIS
jgi:Ni2+-binding GTPase involved in maturation of urease and hydrogenase